MQRHAKSAEILFGVERLQALSDHLKALRKTAADAIEEALAADDRAKEAVQTLFDELDAVEAIGFAVDPATDMRLNQYVQRFASPAGALEARTH